MLVEQHDGVRCLDLLHDQFALGHFLLFLREALRILELGDGDKLEGHVVADPPGVVADASLEVAVGRLAHEYQYCLHRLIPFDGFRLNELVELALVAVEHVDVHIALDAGHATVGTELPESQAHVGLVLAVTRNPHAVVALQVGLLRQIVVHEHLVDVEDGLYARAALDGPEPDAYLLEHTVGPHLLDLRLAGLDVEHGWQVAVPEERVAQEVLRLVGSRGAHRPEVVGTDADAALASLGIVAGVELVADVGALRRLDEDERYGIVGCAADIMAAALAYVDDAQLVPVDGYGPSPLAVLVFRYVDAVDALRGVSHALAHEAVLAPFAGLEPRLLAIGVEQLYAETLAEVVGKVAFRVAAVSEEHGTMAVGFQAGEVAHVDASGVCPQPSLDGVGLPGGNDGSLQRVEAHDGALPLAALPGADAHGGEYRIDADSQAPARGDGGHHLETFILYVVAVEIVFQLVGHFS